MHTVYLSLGTNLGRRRSNISRATTLIREQIGTIVRQSALYETDPWGFNSKKKFINAAICVMTELTPHQLLSATQAIERELGRTHKTKKAADGKPADGTTYLDRIIDIDILLYDDETIDEPNLKIPHPLMYEREFVMKPLREIMPDAATMITTAATR